MRRIERGISKTEKKYFRELTSPSSFVLSKHATALSVKSVSSSIAEPALDHFVTAPPRYSDLDRGDKDLCRDVEMGSQEKASETKSREVDKHFFPKNLAPPSLASS